MATSDAHVRAFIALELPAEAKARLAEVQARLRPRLHGVRWVNAPGLHLTLRFLGDSTPRQIERVTAALETATRECPAGTGRLADVGIFPESERTPPRVLWVGLELPEPFFALQAACERAARDAGFEPERRPFTPHLTLGRWRDCAPRPARESLDVGASGGAAPASGPGARGAGAPRLIAAPESTSGAAGDAGFVLDGVVLYRSELRPSGAVYTALRTFTLAPAAPA